jgi:hypothetical protein
LRYHIFLKVGRLLLIEFQKKESIILADMDSSKQRMNGLIDQQLSLSAKSSRAGYTIMKVMIQAALTDLTERYGKIVEDGK